MKYEGPLLIAKGSRILPDFSDAKKANLVLKVT